MSSLCSLSSDFVPQTSVAALRREQITFVNLLLSMTEPDVLRTNFECLRGEVTQLNPPNPALIKLISDCQPLFMFIFQNEKGQCSVAELKEYFTNLKTRFNVALSQLNERQLALKQLFHRFLHSLAEQEAEAEKVGVDCFKNKHLCVVSVKARPS